MKWEKDLYNDQWFKNISNLDAKLSVAKKIAALVKDGDVIGFGSGSTAYLAAIEIAKKIKKESLDIRAIPTSHEMELVCDALDIPTTNLFANKPDWCFDGADEVDKQLNLIKGRGGALYNEKLVMVNSDRRYILVDNSKLVEHLGTNHPVPIEITPKAINYVKSKICELGATSFAVRMAGSGKDGPVITENGNLIIDARFAAIDGDMEKELKKITGVVESGIFWGYNIELMLI